jgi:hypothetical protein
MQILPFLAASVLSSTLNELLSAGRLHEAMARCDRCYFTGAGGLPFTHAAKGVTPINHFDASRYLGKWYEVARLDNRFERVWSR